MSEFAETEEGVAFIATGNTRETSPEIMRAIAFHARNLSEAEELWDGDGFGRICYPLDLWETVTKNGVRDPDEFTWGAAGSDWWDGIKGL